MSEVAKQNENTSIAMQKGEAWKNMGIGIYNTEISINAKVAKAISSIEKPTTIEDVVKAEAKLKELTSVKNEVVAERKAITTRLDAVGSRLMEPEKNMETAINELKAAIIPIKKEHEKKEQEKQKREYEKKELKERILTLLNNKDLEFKTFINGRVNYAYTYALEHDFKPEEIEEYLSAWSSKYDSKQFNIVLPGYSPSLLSQEEVNQILNENFKQNPDQYLQMYVIELKKKFIDYSVAYNNKKQALELAAKEEEEKQKALIEDAANKEAAIQIEAVSEVLDVTVAGPEIKALKKSYEVDMPETVESVIMIMAAFTANLQLCMPKLKVTKWFKFTPDQAATALSKVKCDDNNFAPKGITFKEVEKL